MKKLASLSSDANPSNTNLDYCNYATLTVNGSSVLKMKKYQYMYTSPVLCTLFIIVFKCGVIIRINIITY